MIGFILAVLAVAVAGLFVLVITIAIVGKAMGDIAKDMWEDVQ